jgi:hypothetical protein
LGGTIRTAILRAGGADRPPQSLTSAQDNIMKRRLVLPVALVGLLATSAAAGAVRHHGWSEYDNTRTLNLTGTVQNIRYGNPHVFIGLRTTGRSARVWEAVLAPPSRMEARGLPQDSLKSGMTARVVGYPHKRNNGEMRAERIIVGNDTTELR